MLENFALITLVAELRGVAVGMTIRRIVQYPGRVFSFETRSGNMKGLRVSLDARTPSLRVPGVLPAQDTVTDDFVMVLRKHLIAGRLVGIEKPLSERIVELRFRTTLPTAELREVSLITELIPNSPNLVLCDAQRRVLATALAPARNRGLALYDEYRYPETPKISLETVVQEDASWFDEPAFESNPTNWLLRHIAGIGPVLAGEIAVRRAGWAATGEGVIGGMRRLISQLQVPARTCWVYSARPLSFLIQEGAVEGLRGAIVSPIELNSLRPFRSVQTCPGMLAAVQAVADPLEAATLLERARTRELRRLGRETNRLAVQRRRLEERKQRFRTASALRSTASLLAASGAEMDRHHTTVTVTEYTDAGSHDREIPLDPTRTLRENVDRMFRQHQKAGRGLAMVERQLADLEKAEAELRNRERQIREIRHWDAWLSVNPGRSPAARPVRKKPTPPSRRGRRISIDGQEILVGRNSRENDELTFRIASADDFWLHVADYSGSHVIVRNPSGQAELDPEVLLRAAQLAAYHSQARNSGRVEVHYTQRKFVGKEKKARPGLVRLRQFKTITVEPRDWPRDVPGEGEVRDSAGGSGH